MNSLWNTPAAECIAALREQAEQYDEPSADRSSRACPHAHASEWSADRSDYGRRRFAQSAEEVRRGRAKGFRLPMQQPVFARLFTASPHPGRPANARSETATVALDRPGRRR
ncbi:hypothetical protein ABT009_33730 [Streptomyces sp. NPDC002896]|uniref:hypothetical protein n=1 Tax=Streptomyces sp. NPDC002896 TaxID=3154438 RepID=UPI0033235395